MPALGFGPYLPDLADLDHPGVLLAQNTIPADNDTYGPLSSLQVSTTALDARCQGAITVRAPTGTVYQFAGTATKLYKLNADGITWDDVSRSSGGAYACPADGGWSFAQFGTIIYASNGVDALQAFTMDSSSVFAALAGSAPIGRLVATVRNFATVLGVPATDDSRFQWSPIGNPAGTWGSVSATQADFQDIPDSGRGMAIIPLAGGAMVLTERAANLFSYEGTPTVFRRDEIARIGCVASGSVAHFGDLHFFLAEQGFYAVNGAGQLSPIGSRKINNYFLRNVAPASYDRITASVDPVNRLYVVAYPSTASGTGTPDSALLYSWDLDRWSTGVFSVELLYGFVSSASYNVDNADSLITPGIDTAPWANISLDSRFWTGTGRLALGGFDTAHKSGSFSGPALEAKIRTREAQLLKGRRARVLSGRPLVDGGTVSVRIGVRNSQSDPVMYSSAVSPNLHGLCPTRSEGRYHSAELTIAAGGSWQHALGFDELQVLAGAPR